jgi:hypothetical protein
MSYSRSVSSAKGAVGWGAAAGERELGDGLGHVVVEHDVARRRGPQGVLQPVGIGALDQVSRGAVAQRGERVVVVLGHREHDDLDLGMLGGEPAVDLQARLVAQAHVQQDDVGPGGGDQRGHLGGVLGFPGDLYPAISAMATARPMRYMGWSSTMATRSAACSPVPGPVMAVPPAAGRAGGSRTGDRS